MKRRYSERPFLGQMARFPPSKGDCIGRATKCRNRPEIGSLPPKTFHLTEGTGTGESPGLLHFMPGDVGELQRGTDLHTPYTPPNSGDVFSGGHRPGRRGGALREGGPCLADVTVDTCVFQGQHTAFRPENLHTIYTPTKTPLPWNPCKPLLGLEPAMGFEPATC